MELRLESEANRECTKQRRHKWKQLGFNYVFKTIASVYKAKPDRSKEIEDFPCADLKYDFLEKFYKKKMAEESLVFLLKIRSYAISIFRVKFSVKFPHKVIDYPIKLQIIF